jgi:hypothetical protein
MVPKEVRTGTGLGQRKTKASKLTRRRAREAVSMLRRGGDEVVMDKSLNVWHIIPLLRRTLSLVDAQWLLPAIFQTLICRNEHEQLEVEPGF